MKRPTLPEWKSSPYWFITKGKSGYNFEASNSQDGVIYIWKSDGDNPQKTKELCEKIDAFLLGESKNA